MSIEFEYTEYEKDFDFRVILVRLKEWYDFDEEAVELLCRNDKWYVLLWYATPRPVDDPTTDPKGRSV